MEHHQRSGAGNVLILQSLLDWFRMPRDFESTLWLSQIVQSIAMKYGVEHWRRSMPRTMGTLYWQLNDCWPVASWSSIDYFGRWKALHYAAVRFYAPVLVSLVEHVGAGTVEVYVTNDCGWSFDGTVAVRALKTDAAVVEERSFPVRVGPRSSKKIAAVSLATRLRQHGAANLIVEAVLETDEGTVSENLALFARPKRLSLLPAGIRSAVSREGDSFRVRLTAARPALWVWLELEGIEARYSDNFFHLLPDREKEVVVTPARKMRADLFEKRLRIRSLRDTF